MEWAGAGVQATRALAHVAAGERTEAQAILSELDGREHPFAVGLIRAALGKKDAAFDAFGRVDYWDLWPTFAVHHWYPDVWTSLQDDPRYEQMVRKVNQSWGLRPDGTMPPPATRERTE